MNRTDPAAQPIAPHDARTTVEVTQRPQAFPRGSRPSIPPLTSTARTAALPDDAGDVCSLVGHGTPVPARGTPPHGATARASRALPPEARTMIERVEAPTTMVRSPALTYARAPEVPATLRSHAPEPKTTVMRSPALPDALDEAKTTVVRLPAVAKSSVAAHSPAALDHARTTVVRSPALDAKPAGSPDSLDARTTVAVAPQAKPVAPVAKAAAPAANPAAAKPAQPAAAKPAAAKPAAQPAAAKPAANPAAKPAAKPASGAAKPKPAAKRPAPQPEPARPSFAAPGPIVASPLTRDSPELYALIRRVALQTDLANAAGVLHSGLGELLGARVAIATVSPRGEITSPIPSDLRDATRLVRLDAIVACAHNRQILGAERYLLVPIIASVPVVLVVWRTPDAPVLDQPVATIAVAAASRLAMLDYFLTTETQAQHQAAADAKTVFRPEALSASRSKHRAGELVNLSPRWVRITLPTILAISAILITLAAVVQVPSYSRGVAVVRMNGHNVISNAQGRINEILVAPGQRVAAGDRLIVLDTTGEQRAFAQIDTVYRDQLGAFLVDPTDEGARQSLAGIVASHTAAKDTLSTRIITAPIDGVVGAILASDTVTAGEHVLTIIPASSEPSVVAFMPGADLARIKVGMVLQVEMTGYTHKRAELVITEVGDEVISQMQARKQLGQKLADAVPLPPSTVMIKARLTSPSFEAKGKTYDYRDGMDGLAEIEVDTKSFLAMVVNTGD